MSGWFSVSIRCLIFRDMRRFKKNSVPAQSNVQTTEVLSITIPLINPPIGGSRGFSTMNEQSP